MNKKILITIALILSFGLGYLTKLISVENEGWTKFDSKKWIPVESGLVENNRKKMVFDLVNNVMENKNGRKLNIKETFKILGENKIINKDNLLQISYDVEEKYRWNIDPEGSTILELRFNKDSIFEEWFIIETWHKP